jgi:arginase
MTGRLDVIGAPSSAGAYAPGQERAPEALRAAGLLASLDERGIAVVDRGDVPGFRWRVDRANPRAMNVEVVAGVARDVADQVAEGLEEGAAILVLGGDCTVELGTVAGASRDAGDAGEIGLIYVDLDTDLNTPASVDDGALDWMGLAHLLGLAGTAPILAGVGPRVPLLRPDQVLLFADNNSTAFERGIIEEQGIAEVRLAQMAADPSAAALEVVNDWARRFGCLLVHVDVDVLDYLDMPIAEEMRRNQGLQFAQLVAALKVLVAAPNWAALTICEVNPDHGELDGSTLRTFNEALADVLSGAVQLRS